MEQSCHEVLHSGIPFRMIMVGKWNPQDPDPEEIISQKDLLALLHPIPGDVKILLALLPGSLHLKGLMELCGASLEVDQKRFCKNYLPHYQEMVACSLAEGSRPDSPQESMVAQD